MDVSPGAVRSSAPTPLIDHAASETVAAVSTMLTAVTEVLPPVVSTPAPVFGHVPPVDDTVHANDVPPLSTVVESNPVNAASRVSDNKVAAGLNHDSNSDDDDDVSFVHATTNSDAGDMDGNVDDDADNAADISDNGDDDLTSNKRELSDGSGSDNAERLSHPSKKGKAIDLYSPDLFDSVVTEAVLVPLPHDDDFLTDPLNSDYVDELPGLSPANDSMDSPLSQFTPNVPAVNPVLPSSSSSGFEMFISRKTRPQPVFGSSILSKSGRSNPSH